MTILEEAKQYLDRGDWKGAYTKLTDGLNQAEITGLDDLNEAYIWLLNLFDSHGATNENKKIFEKEYLNFLLEHNQKQTFLDYIQSNGLFEELPLGLKESYCDAAFDLGQLQKAKVHTHILIDYSLDKKLFLKAESLLDKKSQHFGRDVLYYNWSCRLFGELRDNHKFWPAFDALKTLLFLPSSPVILEDIERRDSLKMLEEVLRKSASSWFHSSLALQELHFLEGLKNLKLDLPEVLSLSLQTLLRNPNDHALIWNLLQYYFLKGHKILLSSLVECLKESKNIQWILDEDRLRKSGLAEVYFQKGPVLGTGQNQKQTTSESPPPYKVQKIPDLSQFQAWLSEHKPEQKENSELYQDRFFMELIENHRELLEDFKTEDFMLFCYQMRFEKAFLTLGQKIFNKKTNHFEDRVVYLYASGLLAFGHAYSAIHIIDQTLIQEGHAINTMAPLYYIKGECHQKLGNLKSSRESFQLAEKLTPGFRRTQERIEELEKNQ